MERLLTFIAAFIAVCVAVLLPTVGFYAGYRAESSIVQAEAEINARLVTDLINDNPELWRVTVLRLEELLSKRPADRTPEIRAVYDEGGALVAQSADKLAAPRLLRRVEVYDAGRAVGQLAIERSLRPLLVQTAVLAVLGLLLGGGAFIALRELPLRALRRTNDRLRHEATHDALTGLPNRMLFLDRLDQAMQQARRRQRPLALMFLDLDGFKDINDSLGHQMGDQVLVHAARRLTLCLEQGWAGGRRFHDGNYTLARLGGDEFTLLLESCGTLAETGALAELLQAHLAEPLQIGSRTVRMRCSIGITVYPQDNCDAGTLMRHADMAMYKAKQRGRNTFQFFSDDLNRQVQQRLSLDQALQSALEGGEFLLHYQPMARLEDGTVDGVEALLRWQRPGKELVPPGEFIAALESSRLIVPVGAWVIETACAQLAAWDRSGPAGLSLAVNLSVHQFQDAALPTLVSRALRTHGIAPHRLELELTESLLMDDGTVVRDVMQRLGALGVRLAIDDFGTGYSSLAYLKRLQVDTLKLDRSFVRDLPHDQDNAAIARAIVAVAHSLGLDVVCEGVETEAQRDLLRGLGCERMQGFLLARPMPADQLATWLSGRRESNATPGLGAARRRGPPPVRLVASRY